MTRTAQGEAGTLATPPDLAALRRQAAGRLRSATTSGEVGIVKDVRGVMIRAHLTQARIGDVCLMRSPDGAERLGEIVGIEGELAYIASFSDLRGICNLTQVIPTNRQLEVAVGPHLLGSVVDAFGTVVRGGDRSLSRSETTSVPVMNRPPLPMQRTTISERYQTGIRAVDTMLATGRGQRMGIFGGAGMGKSTLISMLANNSDCDVAVIGLVGERGREVGEMWERGLNDKLRNRCVLVASTSDRPAVERRLASFTATAIAEAFRDQGLNVLLIVDSLTRFARAQREIGLAAGEPPSRRGFPPSVASMLAELVERAGPGERGTITAFYTVLVEGQLDEDPIAEELKSLLDGHLILTSKLAEAGHFPAIDILASRSRLHSEIVSKEHHAASDHARALLAKFRDIELILQIGEYASGFDRLADEAISKHGRIMEMLRQPRGGATDPDAAIAELIEIAED